MQSMQRNSMLLNGNSRQQRDLFTGSLGIPDVSTHVGSVVHAFELMARNSTGSPTDTIGRASDISLLPAESPLYEIHGDVVHPTIGITSSETSKLLDMVEASGNAGKRQSIYRKSDGTMPSVKKSGHQTIVRQFSEIPTPLPPTPSAVSQNLPILRPIQQAIADDFSSFEAISPAPTTTKYPNHTLPHTPRSNDYIYNVDGNDRNRQFIPASQILRMSAADQQHQQQRRNSKIQRSSAVSGQLARKRASELTRHRTIDDSIGRFTSDNITNTIGDYRRTQFGSQPNVIHDANHLHNNHAPTQTTLARLNGNTNYANIDFREPLDPRSQPNRKSSPHMATAHTARHQPAPHSARSHSKNDDAKNNNPSTSANHGYDGHTQIQQQHERQPSQQQQPQQQQSKQLASDLFAMHSHGLGNRLSNRTNTINNNNTNIATGHGQQTNHNNHNNNNQQQQQHRHRGAAVSNSNRTYHEANNADDDDDDTDDATFLRGTTVSQSFITNMRNSRAIQMPSAHLGNRNSHSRGGGGDGGGNSRSTALSASNAFKRSDTIKPTTTTTPSSKSTSKRFMSVSRSYYKPQKYILNDDDENELRTRYTEHTGRI